MSATAAQDTQRPRDVLVGRREPLLDQILRSSLLAHGLRPMQVDDGVARFLQLVTLMHRPRVVVEIGTYIGYSTIHLARGLPEDGRVTSVEVDSVLADIARFNLAAAGVGDLVDVVDATGADYLAGLAPRSVDMVFIDADKENYPLYLKLSYPALAVGGVLIADDASGAGDMSTEGEGAKAAIDAYNRAVTRSNHLFSSFIDMGNGLMVSYKI
jgi:caffeoyl-CoA O-methyltransferase